MTEKRFQWIYIQEDIVQINDNGIVRHLPPQRLEELLNELNDENEQLKQTIETQNFNYDNAKSIIHDSENQIRNLKDENEQLKLKIDGLEYALKYIKRIDVEIDLNE